MTPEITKPLLHPVIKSGESPPKSSRGSKKIAASILRWVLPGKPKPLIKKLVVDPLTTLPTSIDLNITNAQAQAPSSIQPPITKHEEFLRLLNKSNHNLQKADRTRLLKYIEDNPGKINEVNSNGSTPLTLAAFKGHIEIARLLIQKGANKDQANTGPTGNQNKKQWGTTPLLAAAQNGHIEIARLLIQEGANKDQASNAGLTPLIAAAKKGHLEIVRLFRSTSQKS